MANTGWSSQQVMETLLFTLGGTIHQWNEPVGVTMYSARLRAGVFDPPLNAVDMTPRD